MDDNNNALGTGTQPQDQVNNFVGRGRGRGGRGGF